MTDPLHSFDPDRIAHALEELGLEWADKQAAASALERAVKEKLQQAFLHTTGNVEERKAQAAQDDSYQELAGQYEAAAYVATKAKVRYETYKTKAELLRTLAANQRALANLR